MFRVLWFFWLVNLLILSLNLCTTIFCDYSDSQCAYFECNDFNHDFFWFSVYWFWIEWFWFQFFWFWFYWYYFFNLLILILNLQVFNRIIQIPILLNLNLLKMILNETTDSVSYLLILILIGLLYQNRSGSPYGHLNLLCRNGNCDDFL